MLDTFNRLTGIYGSTPHNVVTGGLKAFRETREDFLLPFLCHQKVFEKPRLQGISTRTVDQSGILHTLFHN